MTIKVLKIIGKNAFLIKPNELNIYTSYYINGNLIHSELKNSVMTFQESDVITFLPSTKTLLGYKKGKKEMTIEEYNSKPKYYDEDSRDEDVLRAIANKKELEGFEPQYKEIEFEPVELEVYGNIEDTKSDFIFCSLTSTYDKNPVVYTINVNKITLDEFEKLKQEYSGHAKFENTERNYLRYAKINDNYAFADCYPFTEIRNEKIFTSLKEAKDEETKIRRQVKDLVIRKVFPKSIDQNKKIMILSNLKAIKKAKTKLVMDEMIQILISDLQDYQKKVELTIKPK